MISPRSLRQMAAPLVRVKAAGILAAALIVALPVAAQQRVPVPEDKPIVVTGERDRQKAITRQTRATAVSVEGQVARFDAAVCVSARGLPEELNAQLAARVAADARAAGVPVDKPGCRPNVIVALVPDGQQSLAWLVEHRRALFGAYPSDALKKMLRDDGPVHVMTLTQLRSRDGRTPGGGAPGGGKGVNGTDIPTLVVDSASILGPPTRQDITGALVLIDAPATEGKTLRQLADYAAMRTLAMTREPKATGGGSTILTLFADGDAAPAELTDFDRGYLRGLYHGPATSAYGSATGLIAHGIRRGDRGRED